MELWSVKCCKSVFIYHTILEEKLFFVVSLNYLRDWMKNCGRIHLFDLRTHVCLVLYPTTLIQTLWLLFINSLNVDSNSHFFLRSAELVASQKGNQKTRFFTLTHSFSTMLFHWDPVAMSYFTRFKKYPISCQP